MRKSITHPEPRRLAKELGLSKGGATGRTLRVGIERAISEPARPKPTAAEMDERREAIIDIVNELGPATVRQVYYQAEVRGVLPKEEKSYNKVQYFLVKLRRSGEIDYDSIVDNTRYPIQPATFESPAEALEDARELSQKSVDRHRRTGRDLAGEGCAHRRDRSNHQQVRRGAEPGSRLCQHHVPLRERDRSQKYRQAVLHLSLG